MGVSPQNKKWLRLVGLIAFLAYLTLCWAAAFEIANWLHLKTGLLSSEFARGLVSLLTGFFLFILTGLITSLFIPKRHVELFQTLIDAFRRIANGDFSVRLEMKGDHRFTQLVEGINHMAEQLNEMERMRQEFISDVSHEIQSPLTSISGFARALRDDTLSAAERERYLDIIETESSRLSKLSENLLRLTSLEARQDPLVKSRYRLDLQLRNAMLVCEPQWLDKRIEMEGELEQTEIAADKDMMSQVWTNLLHNSIKFTPEGGKICVRLLQREQEVEVTIADTGIGIAKEDVERIFERFYKADKSRNRTGGGSGLGLSIVKKIVEMHHGHIHVQSEAGEGTTITLRLPR